jgi:hypothetical protein
MFIIFSKKSLSNVSNYRKPYEILKFNKNLFIQNKRYNIIIINEIIKLINSAII